MERNLYWPDSTKELSIQGRRALTLALDITRGVGCRYAFLRGLSEIPRKVYQNFNIFSTVFLVSFPETWDIDMCNLSDTNPQDLRGV